MQCGFYWPIVEQVIILIINPFQTAGKLATPKGFTFSSSLQGPLSLLSVQGLIAHTYNFAKTQNTVIIQRVRTKVWTQHAAWALARSPGCDTWSRPGMGKNTEAKVHFSLPKI